MKKALVCPKCDSYIKNGRCENCGFMIGTSNGGILICERCGGRGKVINVWGDKTKPCYMHWMPRHVDSVILCYHCYHADDRKRGIYQSPYWYELYKKDPEEYRRLLARQEAYLIPLFYGDDKKNEWRYPESQSNMAREPTWEDQ